MCGIFGIIYYGKTPLVMSELNDIKELTSNLLSASQSRGRDASGICMVTGENKALVLRHHTTGYNLPTIPAYDKIMNQITSSTGFKHMMGHTRAKTQGTERHNINNHPIITDKVIGVHNGAINNDHHLFKLYKDGFPRAGEVDSEIIFRLLNYHIKREHSLTEAVKKTTNALSGWYTCAFIHTDHPNYMTLFGSASASAMLSDFRGVSTMIFASEDKIISDAADCIPAYRYPTAKIQLGGNSGIRINVSDGKIFKFSNGVMPITNTFDYMQGGL